MNGLQIEERTLGVTTSLSLDLARHIAGRLHLGQVVVVSKQPGALLASTRKQWFRVLRRVENRRAGTTNAKTIGELTNKIIWMQQADFSAKYPPEEIVAKVTFATAAQLLEFAPGCRTMYVATPTEKEVLHKITSFMPEGGLVVMYKLADRARGSK